MKKTVWTFGLIAGGILSAMMLLTMPFIDRIGTDHGEVIGYTTMVLAFLLVFFGIRSYRDNVGGGTVGFGRALAVGSLIVLIGDYPTRGPARSTSGREARQAERTVSQRFRNEERASVAKRRRDPRQRERCATCNDTCLRTSGSHCVPTSRKPKRAWKACEAALSGLR